MTDPVTPSHSTTHPLEAILRWCAAAAPEPWYPSDHARRTGAVRDELDPHLNRLRLGGLIQLTDWVKDHGQGYVLTPEGNRVLQSPRELAELSNGRMPETRPAVVETPTERETPRSTWDRSSTIMDGLSRPISPILTKVLLAVNVLWFLSGAVVGKGIGLPVGQYFNGPPKVEGARVPVVAEQYSKTIHRIGALRGADLVDGQWWRLLTCCFVHYGLVHLGVNMLTLYFVGPMMERMWGRGRFLAIYLIAGWGGSCVVMIVNPRTQVAGASGALWGIIASQAVWILMNRSYLPGALSSLWLRNLLTVFLLNAFVSMMPGVSAAAHFGGGAVGAVAGFLANHQRFGSVGQRRLSLLGLVVLPVLCLAALVFDMSARGAWGDVVEATEANHFREEATLALNTGNHALLAFQKILPLIVDYHPDRRDAAEVQKAKAELDKQRFELEQALGQVERAGPYRSAEVEQARQAGINYMKMLIELCHMAQISLLGGEDWKKQEKALIAQWQLVGENRTAWLKALRQAGLNVTSGNEN